MPDVQFHACAVLTRPEGRNDEIGRRLQAQGITVIEAPALSIAPLPAAMRAERMPAVYDLVMFVSSNAAACYVQQLGDVAWPSATLAAAVGAATAHTLRAQAGVPEHLMLYPDQACTKQDSESLWEMLQPHLHRIRRALIVRGETGREWLGERLALHGVVVDRMPVYRRAPAIWTPSQCRQLTDLYCTDIARVWLLTSSEGVDAVAANMHKLSLQQQWGASRFVVIHERIAARLQSVLASSGKVARPMVKVCQPGEASVFQAMLQMAMYTVSS